MYRVGKTKPVKMTRERIKIAAGTRAWNRVRVAEPIVRKIIDMTMTLEKEMSKKKKKGPTSLRKFVMK